MHHLPPRVVVSSCGMHHSAVTGEPMGHACSPVRAENPVRVVRGEALRDTNYRSPAARKENPLPRRASPARSFAPGGGPVHTFTSPGPTDEATRSYVMQSRTGEWLVSLQDVETGGWVARNYRYSTEEEAIRAALRMVGRKPETSRLVHHAHPRRKPNPVRSAVSLRRQQIILPEGVIAMLAKLHGGQGSATYALMSTGMQNLVSLSMIDAAVYELEAERSRARAEHRKLYEDAVLELRDIRQNWREHSAEEAGLLVGRDPETFYEYDSTAREENPVGPEGDRIWRRRQIVLEPELVRHVFAWHGGQGTATYALASTGLHNLVSLQMIDAAIEELEAMAVQSERKGRRKDGRDLRNLAGELRTVRQFWQEHTAQAAGLLAGEDPENFYEYDESGYGR